MDSKINTIIQEIAKTSVGAVPKPLYKGDAVWIETSPEGLKGACVSSVNAGGKFDSAFILPYQGRSEFKALYLFRMQGIGKILILWAHAKSFIAVSPSIPGALWDERKMHELTGAVFEGLEDERPIMIHSENLKFMKDRGSLNNAQKEMYSRPYVISGTGEEGEFQVLVGPVHAGIIEPGHFRFHVIGERINKLEVRMSYVHKGIEELAEGKDVESIFPLIEQISGDESVANSVAYAQAVEYLADIDVPSRDQSIRLILLELERIYSDLADIGGIALDVGYYAASSKYHIIREDMMRLNEKLTGSRFLKGMISIGGVSTDLSEEKLPGISNGIKLFVQELREVEDMTMSSSTFIDRVFTTGMVFPKTAANLSLVGPVARAVGVSCDVRKYFPYGAYKANRINEALAKNGDVMSRFMVKVDEIKESARLIEREIARMPKQSTRRKASNTIPSNESGIGLCEAARGSCTFFVQTGKDGKIARLAVRTASFRNWRAIEKAVLGNTIIADFPVVNKSMNLSYSGTDL